MRPINLVPVTALLVCLLLLRKAASQGALLAPLVREGDYEAVVHNLGLGSLPDEPDGKGDTALLAAAQMEDSQSAEILLQYHGNASLPAPMSGESPFVAAAKRLDPMMIRLFLKYGHSPDIADGHGDAPREVILDVEVNPLDDSDVRAVLALLEQFDEGGAEAFEDPPGTWIRRKAKENGMVFFYNMFTHTSTYLPPTSCSWRMTTHPDHMHLPFYINMLTKQTKFTRPKALDWYWNRQESGHKDGFWHNSVTGLSVWEAPGEVYPELLEEIIKGYFWQNAVTGETSWRNPAEMYWRQALDSEGLYWFHPVTGESTRKLPPEMKGWIAYWSEEHSKRFFSNKYTGESQWDLPEPFAWIQHVSDPGSTHHKDEL
mmetsp:Transcript_32536/g.92265  ORF Transcript_32536/g.92265 Transcript_32536/m.92265 type:complete len:373 (-) Transcript_32536:421-1539(-)